MQRTSSRQKAAIFPLTIETPYGLVRLEMQVCKDCDSHFNFRIVEAAPALSTRAAEPFLWRLMNTMEAIGSDLWMELPPPGVRRSIELGTYKGDRLVLPASDV